MALPVGLEKDARSRCTGGCWPTSLPVDACRSVDPGQRRGAAGAELSRSGDRLDRLAEAVHGPPHLLVGVLDELGDQLAGFAAWRVALQRDLDVGPTATVVEPDGAGVVDVGVANALPGDALVGDVLGDLGVPLDRLAERSRDLPWSPDLLAISARAVACRELCSLVRFTR